VHKLRFLVFVCSLFLFIASPALAKEQQQSSDQATPVVDRAEAGRILLEQGIVGLRQFLERGGHTAADF